MTICRARRGRQQRGRGLNDPYVIGILQRHLAGPRHQQITAASDGAEQRSRTRDQDTASLDQYLHVFDTPVALRTSRGDAGLTQRRLRYQHRLDVNVVKSV